MLDLMQPGTCLVSPFLGSGFTLSGIYAEFDNRLPPVLARVLASHPKSQFKQGDLVVYRQGSLEETTADGEKIYILADRAVCATLKENNE